MKDRNSRHDGWQLVQLFLVVQDKEDRPDEYGDHIDGEEDEEAEEVAVVATADTVVDPRTVVIEGLDTSITVGAVGTAGRAVELTGHTPLHANLSTINFNSLIERCTKVVVNVFVRRCCHMSLGQDQSG